MSGRKIYPSNPVSPPANTGGKVKSTGKKLKGAGNSFYNWFELSGQDKLGHLHIPPPKYNPVAGVHGHANPHGQIGAHGSYDPNKPKPHQGPGLGYYGAKDHYTPPSAATKHLGKPKGKGGVTSGVVSGKGSGGSRGADGGGSPVTGASSAPASTPADTRVDDILKAMLNAARVQSQAVAGHITRSGLDLDKAWQATIPAAGKVADTAIDNNNSSIKATGATLDATAAATPNITGQTAEGAKDNTNLQVAAERSANDAQGQLQGGELSREKLLGNQYMNINRMADQQRTRDQVLAARDPYTQAQLNAPMTKFQLQQQLEDQDIKKSLAGMQINQGNEQIASSQAGRQLAQSQFDWNKQMQQWQQHMTAKEFALKKKQLSIAQKQVAVQNAKTKGNLINQILAGQPTTVWSVGKGKNGPVSVRQTIPGYGRPSNYSEAVQMLLNTGMVSPKEAKAAALGAGYSPEGDVSGSLLGGLSGFNFGGLGS